jgi:hypothetical protein
MPLLAVAGADRTINPDPERFYAKRAYSHAVEVAGASHSVSPTFRLRITPVYILLPAVGLP